MNKLENINNLNKLKREITPKLRYNWEINKSLSSSFLNRRMDVKGGSMRLLTHEEGRRKFA